MTGTTLEAVKDRIRKLLSVSKEGSGATEGEVDNALRFAQAMMLRHHLTEADIDDACADEDVSGREAGFRVEDLEYGMAELYSQSSNVSLWEKILASAIVDLVGSIGWYFTREVHWVNRRFVQRVRFTFYGPAEDVEVAKQLMAEWSITLAGMARLKWGGCFRGPGRSYCEGFAKELALKARLAKREQQDSAKLVGGRALILLETADRLAHRKREYAETWLRSQGIRVHVVGNSSCGQHFDTAYKEGRGDGRKAEFSVRRNPKLTN